MPRPLPPLARSRLVLRDCCESASVNSSNVIANRNIYRSRADRLAPFSESDLLWRGRGATKQHFAEPSPGLNAGALLFCPNLRLNVPEGGTAAPFRSD
jgi:hypothetical protein